MRLTELIVSIAIFLIACVVFSASLINVRRSVIRSEDYSKNAVILLDVDNLIRKEIREINISYWKNFDMEFEKEKNEFEEYLKILGKDIGFEVTNVSTIYDRKHCSEGIKVEWKIYDNKYVCQEFIKQRIVNGEY